MTYQVVPPDDHWHNLTDKLIQTWNENFIGVMSSTSDSFPAHLWCQAIHQAGRQLRLLQQSNVKPKISVYAYVYRTYD